MKAILILDKMPKDCCECEFGSLSWDVSYCDRVHDDMGFEKKNEDLWNRTTWCPLKELPKRLEQYAIGDRPLFDPNFIDGFNLCLEEIERE